MVALKQERLLTLEERRTIWAAIFSNQHPDDRNPEVIIQEDYKGNVEAYLTDMRKWHNTSTGNKN